MKARLNLTIDISLLDTIKAYASNKHTSVSELVEDYFKRVTKSSKRKTIITLVDKLKMPELGPKVDLRDSFYQDQAKKYGF
jgi:hypothetical protein